MLIKHLESTWVPRTLQKLAAEKERIPFEHALLGISLTKQAIVYASLEKFHPIITFRYWFSRKNYLPLQTKTCLLARGRAWCIERIVAESSAVAEDHHQNCTCRATRQDTRTRRTAAGASWQSPGEGFGIRYFGVWKPHNTIRTYRPSRGRCFRRVVYASIWYTSPNLWPRLRSMGRFRMNTRCHFTVICFDAECTIINIKELYGPLVSWEPENAKTEATCDNIWTAPINS